MTDNFNFKKILDGITDANLAEYIQYTTEEDQALTTLEESLHDSDDPEEIIMKMLIAVVEFYDGDWSGIFEADLTMKIWSPLWWYNRGTNGMTPNRFGDLEEGEYLIRWIEALMYGNPIIIEDVETLADTAPQEYQFMKDNGVHSMIAVPFWKRPTGFLVVRNPKRYIRRTSLLKMMAFVAVSSINEKRLMDSAKLKQTPEIIQKGNDIVINLFDNLQIVTGRGVLTEKDLNSPKMSKLIVYLLLHTRRPASPHEIVSTLWPDDEICNASSVVKNLIYRLQQSFSLISDYRLIESTISGYWLNPELNIMTDMDMFEDLRNKAQVTADLHARGLLLKEAMDLYKHGLIKDYSGEHWFMPTEAHYSLRYAGVVNQLLATLDMANDYVCIYEYANNALMAFPSNGDFYYWLIYSMIRLGMIEIAKNEIKAAKQMLTENDYADLIERLKAKSF